MSAITSHPRDSSAPVPVPDLLASWPRSTQYLIISLTVVTLGLLTAHILIANLSDARPTTLVQGNGPSTAINLNTADHALLRQLPELGDTLATAIIEYRRSRGGFTNVDELQNVPGIGRTRLARLRQWVYVEEAQAVSNNQGSSPISLTGKSPNSTRSRPKKSAGLKGLLDLNTATEEELRLVDGLGPVLARRIVEARQKRPYRAVEDLLQIPNLKHKTLEKVRPYVTVNAPITQFSTD